jgi:hypothetical protein
MSYGMLMIYETWNKGVSSTRYNVVKIIVKKILNKAMRINTKKWQNVPKIYHNHWNKTMAYNFHILCKFPKSFISAYDMKIVRQHQASKVLAHFSPILHLFACSDIQTTCNTRNYELNSQISMNRNNLRGKHITKSHIKHQHHVAKIGSRIMQKFHKNWQKVTQDHKRILHILLSLLTCKKYPKNQVSCININHKNVHTIFLEVFFLQDFNKRTKYCTNKRRIKSIYSLIRINI